MNTQGTSPALPNWSRTPFYILDGMKWSERNERRGSDGGGLCDGGGVMGRTDRTTAGLREALFDQLDNLRFGDGVKEDVDRARAVAMLAREIIHTAKAELEFHQALNRDDKLCDDFMTGQLKLGGSAKRESEPSAKQLESAASAKNE